MLDKFKKASTARLYSYLEAIITVLQSRGHGISFRVKE